MGQFSEDGQWWWDGQAWIPTAQILIPEIPPAPGSERVQETARRFSRWTDANLIANSVSIKPTPKILEGAGLLLGLSNVFLLGRAYRAFRELKLIQLAAASTYLLGAEEPVVAAEAGIYPSVLLGWVRGVFAIVVTKTYVLVLASAKPLAPPRRVLLAARPNQVRIEKENHGWLNLFPTLIARQGGRAWRIMGTPKVFEPQPVLDAWRHTSSRC